MLELEVGGVTLQFEHSLLSLSKWESKHLKPFMGKIPPTPQEMIDYFECMIISPGVDPLHVYGLAPGQMEELARYINTPQTASSVPKDNTRGPSETVTSELIYYWMTAMKINWEAQSWHLSRLMMLIQIVNFKNQPEKSRNRKATMERWQDANERQKQFFKTKG